MIRFQLPYLRSWKRPRPLRNGKGLYDPGAKDLREAKANLLKQAQDQGVTPGPNSQWALTIAFVQRDRRSRDIDRLLSFVMDALEGALYANDNQVNTVLMEKHTDHQGANCVFIEAHPMD